jgi:hypothetical protein
MPLANIEFHPLGKTQRPGVAFHVGVEVAVGRASQQKTRIFDLEIGKIDDPGFADDGSAERNGGNQEKRGGGEPPLC